MSAIYISDEALQESIEIEESSMKVSRRKINQIGGAVATTSVMGSALSRPVFAEDTKKGGGALYMQTNELENAVIRFSRAKNGILKQEQRIATGGRGSGVFKPVSGQASAPNAFEGAGSVITTDDMRPNRMGPSRKSPVSAFPTTARRGSSAPDRYPVRHES